MRQAELVAMPARGWHSDPLDDVAQRLTLEHYDREALPLRRYLIFLGLPGHIAEELVHEAFIRLHEHLLGRGDSTNVRAWLYRVAHNLGRNAQSASQSRKTDPLSDPTGAPLDLPSNDASVEEQLLTRERELRLQHALSLLTPAQRDALLLRGRGDRKSVV